VTDRIRITRGFAIATAIGMLIVLLMGARVTATGSADGCGNDWPLCHGSFLPAGTYESLVEYSHRIVTGAEGILVAITSILAWPMRRRYPEVKILVPVMAGTLVLQSLMGAAAVKWPQTPEVLASHFGISLICLASAALLARVLTDRRPEKGRDDEPALKPRLTDHVLLRFRRVAVASVAISILVAYSGAYVRHRGAELACTSWPTCNGELIPEFGGLHGVQTMHRIGALIISLVIFGLLTLGYRLREARPDLFTISVLGMLLVVVQSLSGAVVIASGLQLMATLAHAGIMSLLFVTLCDGVRMSWRRHAEAELSRIGGELRGMAVGD
jgi:cytochrome c oxidase assembly protein subunit 15